MKNLAEINNLEINNLLIPSVNHKELEDTDCGLPENPIFSNYSKYLWKRAVSKPKIWSVAGLRENTNKNKDRN